MVRAKAIVEMYLEESSGLNYDRSGSLSQELSGAVVDKIALLIVDMSCGVAFLCT